MTEFMLHNLVFFIIKFSISKEVSRVAVYYELQFMTSRHKTVRLITAIRQDVTKYMFVILYKSARCFVHIGNKYSNCRLVTLIKPLMISTMYKCFCLCQMVQIQ